MDDFGLHQISIGQRLIAGRVGTPSEQGFVLGGTSLSLRRACDYSRRMPRPAQSLWACHPSVCSFGFEYFVFFVVPTAVHVGTPSAEPLGVPPVHRRKQAGQKNSDEDL